MSSMNLLRHRWRQLTVALALFLPAVVLAQVYDFNRFLSGGGGGADPRKQAIARGMGAYICLAVGPGQGGPTGTVLFSIWSMIPERNARLRAVTFDTGRHKGLFSSFSVVAQSPGIKPVVIPPAPHAFLPRVSPVYWVDLPSTSGLAPGQSITVAANLAPGKTYTDVMMALGEGMNPASATTGLRVAVLALYLLGGPPPGVPTIMDDGGFVVTSVSPTCAARR